MSALGVPYNQTDTMRVIIFPTSSQLTYGVEEKNWGNFCVTPSNKLTSYWLIRNKMRKMRKRLAVLNEPLKKDSFYNQVLN